MKKKSTKQKSTHYIKSSMSGITLIALVITIIVLLILAGVSLSAVLGENGIVNRAENAVEVSRISAAKEQIELAVLGTHMDKMKNNEPFDLEYIKDNIGKELGGLEIIGTHGSPIDRVYVKYDDEQFMIDEEGNVIHIGDVELNTVPDLAVIPDQVVTGVEKVVLDLTSDVELGQITKIKTPTGEITGGNGTYEITENGTYEFTVYTDQGTEIKKTVVIDNIQKPGLDITGYDTGGENHQCIYESKYDETNHWEECILCNNIINQKSHSKVRSWILGSESCRYTNSYIDACESCGYSIKGNKACQWDGVSYVCNAGDAPSHFKKCSVCNYVIAHGYYYNGTYYEGSTGESCTTSSGELIGCQKLGTCRYCNNTYYATTAHHRGDMQLYTNETNGNIQTVTGRLYCTKCDITIANITETMTRSEYSDTQVKNYAVYDLTYVNGFTYNSFTANSVASGYSGWATSITSNATVNSSTSVRFTVTAITNGKMFVDIGGYLVCTHKYNGVTDSAYPGGVTFKTDITAPVINSITQTDITVYNDWATSKQITISGTENLSDMVYVTIKNKETDEVILDNVATMVSNGAYSYTCTPLLEGTESGTTYTVSVTDRSNNVITQDLTVQKIDNKPPEFLTIIEDDGKWAKRRSVYLEATDNGIGKVEFGFNTQDEYKLGTLVDNKYTISYNLIGDQYEAKKMAIYVKDAIGNLTTGTTVVIGKIDSTSPTINNIAQTKDGNTTQITVEANDYNSTLTTEGSGINGYAITKSKEMPSVAIYQASNTFNIDTAGTYYIWVKDNAGNIAERKEIVVE